ncbi:MAG TPA: hypothetical protein ENG73_00875 [Desulfobacterales bacterium]|nr:hypothetical protein [Desulfobacterales bacterium]
MQQKAKEPRSPVNKDRAMEHALLAIRRVWAGEIPEFKEWGGFELDPEPLILHDINGQVLFYEFNVMDGTELVGSVKVSASKTIGSAVPAIQIGPRRWDPNTASKQAEEKVKERFPKAKVVGTELVCYSYPKIGVRVYIEEPEIGNKSLILDAADQSLIEEFGADGPVGQIAWSFYHEMAMKNTAEREGRWERTDEELEAFRSASPKILDPTLTRRELVKFKPTFVLKPREVYPYPIPFFSLGTVRFSPRCSTHECFELYAQKTNVYCAVATGQMLLDFYRYYHSQADIATAMGTGPHGTSISGMVNGLEQLSKKCLDATWDGTASWSEARTEIDANRPLASIIPGHARVCAGWKKQNICLWPGPCRRWLKIYDPWPWNANICNGGSIYWEDWDLQTHWGFIYLRHRATPCP